MLDTSLFLEFGDSRGRELADGSSRLFFLDLKTCGKECKREASGEEGLLEMWEEIRRNAIELEMTSGVTTLM